MAFAFLCTAPAGTCNDRLEQYTSGRSKYEPPTLEDLEPEEPEELAEADQDSVETPECTERPKKEPVGVDEPQEFQSLYDRYVQLMMRSRTYPAEPVSQKT